MIDQQFDTLMISLPIFSPDRNCGGWRHRSLKRHHHRFTVSLSLDCRRQHQHYRWWRTRLGMPNALSPIDQIIFHHHALQDYFKLNAAGEWIVMHAQPVFYWAPHPVALPTWYQNRVCGSERVLEYYFVHRPFWCVRWPGCRTRENFLFRRFDPQPQHHCNGAVSKFPEV